MMSSSETKKRGRVIGGVRYFRLGELGEEVGRSRWYMTMMSRAGFAGVMPGCFTVDGYLEWMKENEGFVAADWKDVCKRKK